MSNQDKHIARWSASDVQKYLKGELSAREMNQLERAALEDPFLADALEGLSQRPAIPRSNDLDELRTRLNARVSKKKRSIGWIKMAAAIAVLIGLGYTAWYLLLDNHKSPQAGSALTFSAHRQAPPPAANTAPAIAKSSPSNLVAADTVAVADALNVARTPLAKINPSAHKFKAVRPAADFERKGEAEKSVADSISVQNSRVASLDFIPAPPQANQKTFRPDSLQLSGNYRVESKLASNNFNGGYLSNNLVYNGQVLDFNNRPLAGASLLVSGPSNANTTTNALGQFKLNLRPQDSTQQLTVAMTGYQAAYVAVNKLNLDQVTGNTIVLRERPAALNEVVVSGMDKRAREAFATAPNDDKSEKLDSFWIKIAPITGRLAYLDYLQIAKKTLAVDTAIEGAEVVSFTIDPKGVPVDFKIEQSLSPAHDAGVIRLITEGARWKIIRGKNTRALVSVSFP